MKPIQVSSLFSFCLTFFGICSDFLVLGLSPNEAEFRSYQLLIVSDNDVVDMMRQLAALPVYKQKPVQFAKQVIAARHTQNYCEYFRLFQKADFLTACLMHRRFHPIRAQVCHPPPNLHLFQREL